MLKRARNDDFDKILKIRKRTARKNDVESVDQFFKSMLKSPRGRKKGWGHIGVLSKCGRSFVEVLLKAKRWCICSSRHAISMPTHANSMDRTGLRPVLSMELACLGMLLACLNEQMHHLFAFKAEIVRPLSSFRASTDLWLLLRMWGPIIGLPPAHLSSPSSSKTWSANLGLPFCRKGFLLHFLTV